MSTKSLSESYKLELICFRLSIISMSGADLNVIVQQVSENVKSQRGGPGEIEVLPSLGVTEF